MVAVSVAAACYYAFIIFVFYRKDIFARLKGNTVATATAKPVQNQPAYRNLMGAIAPGTSVRRKPLAESSVNTEEVEVAEMSVVSDHPASAPADELLQELGNLFEIMREGKPSQEAYVKNIKTLFSQYVHLIGPEEYTRISVTIIDELKTKHDIFLSTELVEELWPKETVKHSNHSK